MANKSPLVLSDGVEQLQSTDSLIASEYVGIANVILTPTGAGAIQAGTGGDARGNYAVDLQLSRAANTQVASGNYSFLAGNRNTCAANYSAVVGGYNNVVNATSGTGACAIVGGFDNTATQSSPVAMVGCRQCQNIGDSVNRSYYNGLVGCLNSTLEYVRFSGAVGLQSCTMTGVSDTPINNCAMVGCNGCGITESGSSIVGGNTCTISGKNSSIVGGYGHTITSRYSFIAGGYSNQVNAQYGFVSGRENTIPVSTGDCNTIGGGYSNTTVAASTYNGHNILAGGYNNSIQGIYCTIGGGYSNDIINADGAINATIAGGADNTITSSSSTIGGGNTNTVSGAHGTIAGGNTNTVSGTYGTIAGGHTNTVFGTGGFVGGGDTNTIPTACGDYNTIGGGYSNTIIAAATNNGNNVIAGGNNSSIQGAYCVISGGRDNDITLADGAENAAIVGGFNNTVTANGGYIGCGYSNTVSGDYAAILSGVTNTASGEVSVASGRGAVAAQYGQHTQSSGYLVAAGDAQTSILVMRNATTDDTVTELFLNGGTVRLVIPEDTTWFVTVKVVGRQTNDDFTVYGLNWTGLLTRNAGGNATLTNSNTVTEYLNDFSWSCAISANTTNQSLEILVQGGATDTVNWVARVELVETVG